MFQEKLLIEKASEDESCEECGQGTDRDNDCDVGICLLSFKEQYVTDVN